MPLYNDYRVTIRTSTGGSVQIVISALDSGNASRTAASMFPGSTVTMVEMIRGG